jgi:hypothetical protein
MQDRVTRRSTSVLSRVTTPGVLNRHGEVHADPKSNQGMIHTKIPSTRGGTGLFLLES